MSNMPLDPQSRRSTSTATAASLTGTGVIMGIEVLGIDVPEQIAIPQKFAAEHDLAFPRDLAGTLAA